MWESHADWWQAGFTEGADPEYEEQILPLAAEHLAGARSVLDVGCGEGQVARLARRLGVERVVGLDPTHAQIAEVSKRAGGPAYLCGSAAYLPFGNGSFDAVVASRVRAHPRG